MSINNSVLGFTPWLTLNINMVLYCRSETVGDVAEKQSKGTWLLFVDWDTFFTFFTLSISTLVRTVTSLLSYDSLTYRRSTQSISVWSIPLSQAGTSKVVYMRRVVNKAHLRFSQLFLLTLTVSIVFLALSLYLGLKRNFKGRMATCSALSDLLK